jgi:peptidoglycan/xylan/chitin deacetylase (PgdA/CDA1 family)
MALGPSTSVLRDPEKLRVDSKVVGSGNDAFSFWKLPEEWRSSLSCAVEASRSAAERYLFELYLSEKQRRPPVALGSYYRFRNFVPRWFRHWLNSAAIRARGQRRFPSWPCESVLLDFWRDWLIRALRSLDVKDGWHIGFWPQNARCCVVLTHDVESPLGIRRMEKMADVEQKYGFLSSWNLPLSEYPIDWRTVERLRARGFEIGAHGLAHDGKLFRSEADFAELRPKLEQLAREHSMVGFRSPSTLRRAEWIGTLAFEYDSSFADTDPYEPQPGGSCSIFPFHLGALIELPYTLPQDHTLIHLIHRDPVPLWHLKAQWIAAAGGMILTLTHPDYMGAGEHLARYEELLKRLRDFPDAWHALPSDVANWWRRRSRMKLCIEGGQVVIKGDNTSGAVAVRLSDHPLCALG